MTLQQVIDHFGSKSKVAEALGLVRSTVTNWGDEVPFGFQCEIQVITKGKLKADPKAKKSRKTKAA